MARASRALVPGLALVSLGLLFLFDSLGYMDFSVGALISRFWPLALVIAGLAIIFGYHEKIAGRHPDPIEGAANSSASKFFGDLRIDNISGVLGTIDRSLFAGDIIIDLTGASLRDGENFLAASVVFGDILITAPAGFAISANLSCIAGSVSVGGKKSDGILPRVRHMDDDFEGASSKMYIVAKTVFGDVKVERCL